MIDQNTWTTQHFFHKTVWATNDTSQTFKISFWHPFPSPMTWHPLPSPTTLVWTTPRIYILTLLPSIKEWKLKCNKETGPRIIGCKLSSQGSKGKIRSFRLKKKWKKNMRLPTCPLRFKIRGKLRKFSINLENNWKKGVASLMDRFHLIKKRKITSSLI